MISRVKGKTEISRSYRVMPPVVSYSRWLRQSGDTKGQAAIENVAWPPFGCCLL